MKKSSGFLLVLFVLFSLPGDLVAQGVEMYLHPTNRPVGELSRPIEGNTYGTPANYTWISNEDFRAWDSATTWTFDLVSNDHYVYRAAGGGAGYFVAHLDLEDGVLINSIRFYYRDFSGTANPAFFLTKMQTDVDTGANPLATILVGPIAAAGTPGYTSINANVNTTYRNTESGKDNRWILVVNLPFDGTNIAFGGARVSWTRQISPAPNTATFSDVPTTHPLFQYIEALAASGITAGCVANPPQFCPDANMTRGQMAVFISRALGLHFAP